MPYDIFVSYSSANRDRVRPFAEHLKSLRLNVFFDAESIAAAENWSQSIRDALADSRCVIVFWTPQSANSSNVGEEALNALPRGALIPVLLEATSLPYGVATASARDLRSWRGRFDQPEWVQVLKDIGAAVRRPGLSEWGMLRAKVEAGEDLAVCSAQLRDWLKSYQDDPSAGDVRQFLETHAIKLNAAEEKHAAKVAAERHRREVEEQKKLSAEIAAEKKRQREAARSGFEKFLRTWWLPISLVVFVALVTSGFILASAISGMREEFWVRGEAPDKGMRPAPVVLVGESPQLFASGEFFKTDGERTQIYRLADDSLVATFDEMLISGDSPVLLPYGDAPLVIWDAETEQRRDFPDAGRVISTSHDRRFALVSKAFAAHHGANLAIDLTDMEIFRASSRDIIPIADKAIKSNIQNRIQKFSGGAFGSWSVSTSALPGSYCNGFLYLPSPDGMAVLNLETGESPGIARTAAGRAVDVYCSAPGSPAVASGYWRGDADAEVLRHIIGADGIVTREKPTEKDYKAIVQFEDDGKAIWRGQQYAFEPAVQASEKVEGDPVVCSESGVFMLPVTRRTIGVWRLDSDAAHLVALLFHPGGGARADAFSADCRHALTSSSSRDESYHWRLPL